MNDRDLSRPATRQRTSNAFRPGLRRIAKIRTSNELTAIPPLEMTGTSRSQSHHKKNIPVSHATAFTPRPRPARQLIPGRKRPATAIRRPLAGGLARFTERRTPASGMQIP